MNIFFPVIIVLYDASNGQKKTIYRKSNRNFFIFQILQRVQGRPRLLLIPPFILTSSASWQTSCVHPIEERALTTRKYAKNDLLRPLDRDTCTTSSKLLLLNWEVSDSVCCKMYVSTVSHTHFDVFLVRCMQGFRYPSVHSRKCLILFIPNP